MKPLGSRGLFREQRADGPTPVEQEKWKKFQATDLSAAPQTAVDGVLLHVLKSPIPSEKMWVSPDYDTKDIAVSLSR